jgi:DNA gyrase subunit B
VTIHIDDSVTVVDNGRGIPVGIKEEYGVSAAEIVMTKAPCGRQVRREHLQGVGRPARRGRELRERAVGDAASGDLARPAYVGDGLRQGHPRGPLKQTGKAGSKTGTKITFKPDGTIMDATKFNFDTLSTRLREMAFLNKGLKITLTDERTDPVREHEFFYSGGISEFIKHLNKGKNTLHDKPIAVEGERELPNGGTLSMEIAMQWNDSYSDQIFSFANNINTRDGGTHLTGFRTALTRTLNACAKAGGAVQGSEGFEPVGRRRAGGSDGGGEREAAAAAV